MRRVREIAGILSIVVLLLTGCGGDDGGPNVEYMRGWVFAEKPISGATVRVYHPGGNSFTESGISSALTTTTEDQGTFLIRAPGLPEDFRVVASNGKQGEQAFTAELKADVRSFNPETDIVYVNVVTTMVSVYLDKHPEKTLEEATTVIKNFLEIPKEVAIGEDLHNSEIYFSHTLFIAEAQQNGGVNSFIGILLQELENNPEKTHPFYALQIFTDPTSGIIAKIGDKLVDGAISYVGGKLFGWSLKKFGGPDLEGGAFKEVLKSLEEIKTMLSELSSKMDRIYEQLSAQITQTEYNIRIGQINPLMNTIKSTSASVTYLTSLTPTEGNKTFIESEKERIKIIIGTQILPQASAINDQLIGTAGAEGLLKIWGRVVKNKHRFFGQDDSKQVQAQFNYFDAIQLSLIELVIEYYHAIDAPKEVILTAIEQYTNNRKAQLAMRPLLIPEGAIVETHSGLMIYPLDVRNAYQFATSFPPFSTDYGTHFWYMCIYLETSNTCGPNQSYNINFRNTGKPLLEFNNWRMATRSEAQRMFELRTGQGVGTWAVSQGYPKDYINDNMKVFLDDDPFPYGYKMQCKNCYVYFTKDGTIKANPWTWGGGWTIPHNFGEKYGHLIPVRSPGQGEFYFW